MNQNNSAYPRRAGACIELPAFLREDLTGLNFSLVLLGRFIDERFLGLDGVLPIISAIWRLNGAITVRVMEPFLIFIFSDVSDYNYVKNLQSLNMEGSLLVFRPIVATSVPEHINFHLVPLWVRVRNLPFQLMNSAVAAHLLSHVGTICEEEVVPDILPNRNFIRIKVWIDLTKPLVPGCYIPMGGREHQWIIFSYEGVFHFCKRCGVVGHTVSFCPMSESLGAACIASKLAELRNSGHTILHGPPNYPFYSSDIFGLPSRLHYLSTPVDVDVPSPPVVMDTEVTSPIFPLSTSTTSDDENQYMQPDMPSDPGNELLLMREYPVLRGPFPFPSTAADRSSHPTPAFRMQAPDPAQDASLEITFGNSDPAPLQNNIIVPSSLTVRLRPPQTGPPPSQIPHPQQLRLMGAQP